MVCDMLPKDPMMLMSVVNTKLRDVYPSLDALCDDLDIDTDIDKANGMDKDSINNIDVKEYIIHTLQSIGYVYNAELNRFI